MTLLIDGYNLLNSTGIGVEARGAGTLEQARLALLEFLSEILEADELARTTVVFDAAQAPPGLPPIEHHGPLTVRFAKGYADADTLLEELIRQDHAPRQLTVVSSDHRVQRAARRRRATAVDSDRWYAALRNRCRGARNRGAKKPEAPASPGEVAAWLEYFADRPAPAPSGAEPPGRKSPPRR